MAPAMEVGVARALVPGSVSATNWEASGKSLPFHSLLFKLCDWVRSS